MSTTNPTVVEYDPADYGTDFPTHFDGVSVSHVREALALCGRDVDVMDIKHVGGRWVTRSDGDSLCRTTGNGHIQIDGRHFVPVDGWRDAIEKIDPPPAWAIRELRDAAGGTTAMAEALNTSSRTVRKWLAGDRQPRGPAVAAMRMYAERLDSDST
jgi:hypothetical protein